MPANLKLRRCSALVIDLNLKQLNSNLTKYVRSELSLQPLQTFDTDSKVRVCRDCF